MSWRLASYNVFEWLVQAKTLGCETVVFDIRGMHYRKWSPQTTRMRFRSICLPAPALAGMGLEVYDERTIGKTGAEEVAGAGGGALVSFWRKHCGFERLKSVRPPGKARYTVTLRRTERSPGRNSDEALWREFADEIGALVIPDYEDKRIHLHERMAWYAGAEMNFFVSNGPAVLCSLTDYPCMIFDTQKAAGSLAGDGLPGWGAQYPWLRENQRAIWEEPSHEALRAYFYHWKETGEFLGRDLVRNVGSPEA